MVELTDALRHDGRAGEGRKKGRLKELLKSGGR
jgi:hypothetical protein